MQDLKMVLIQSDIIWQSPEANFAAFEEKIWAITQEVDVVVLPEMFTTGFTVEPHGLSEPVNGKTYKWLYRMAQKTDALVMGTVIINEKNQYFNRLLACRPDGRIFHYDKHHLFSLADEDKYFTAGAQRIILSWRGWRLMPLVCYDLRFPVWSKSRFHTDRPYEYDLVIYCANWPAPRIKAWDALLRARAIENSAYAIGVNRVGQDGYQKEYPGHTAVYDFLGNTSAFNAGGEVSLYATLSSDRLAAYRERYPFQKDSDSFSPVC